MRKKKILVLPSWYPSDALPVYGTFIQEQACVLSQKYDVAVFVPEAVGLKRFLKKVSVPVLQMENREGLRVYRMLGAAPLRFSPKFFYPCYAWIVEKGFRQILKTWGRPDVIHAHVVLPAGWAGARLSTKYSIPVVLTEHSCPFSMHLQSKHSYSKVQEVLGSVDSLVAISPSLKGEIDNFKKGLHIEVIGEVIKTEFFRPAPVKKDNSTTPIVRFFSLALLDERKGLSYLLQAASLLVERGINSFEIVIGGDGPDRTRLEKLAMEAGLQNHCRFIGMLAQPEVRNWMQWCDVFVLPSLAETFGVVLGEAMACGKPVIATRCGGPEFVVTPDTGLLVNVADPEDLATAMGRFLLVQIDLDANSIRQSVKRRFGEEAFLSNISNIYDEVLSGYRN